VGFRRVRLIQRYAPSLWPESRTSIVDPIRFGYCSLERVWCEHLNLEIDIGVVLQLAFDRLYKFAIELSQIV